MQTSLFKNAVVQQAHILLAVNWGAGRYNCNISGYKFQGSKGKKEYLQI